MAVAELVRGRDGNVLCIRVDRGANDREPPSCNQPGKLVRQGRLAGGIDPVDPDPHRMGSLHRNDGIGEMLEN